MRRNLTFVLSLTISSMCSHGAAGQVSSGPFQLKLVESDGQEWPLEILRDSVWVHFDIPLSAFGAGGGFLNTPVTKLALIPKGGGGLIGGPQTEIAEWVDNIVMSSTLIDNFDDGDYSDWFRQIALNGSYLQPAADTQTPDGSSRCMKLIHGNSMGASFIGWMEKRFTGLTLSPSDTLRFWLRGKSYSISDVPSPPTGIPPSFALEQNYPNPFNPTTGISYQTSEVRHVTLKVFDMLGREVATLADDVEDAGYKSVRWNATGVTSGVYLCQMQAGEFVFVKRMLLVK